MDERAEGGRKADYPISIRLEDLTVAPDGDVLIAGPKAEAIRRLLLNHPWVYPRLAVPFIRRREPSFRPEELWIDPKGRVHLSNAAITRRIRHHLRARNRAD